MSDNSSDFGSFLAGFLIGGLVGAATALLLAPQSGEETRTVIKSRSIELKEKAMTEAENLRARVEEFAREKGWTQEQTDEIIDIVEGTA
jgi:gas vesicle protein